VETSDTAQPRWKAGFDSRVKSSVVAARVALEDNQRRECWRLMKEWVLTLPERYRASISLILMGSKALGGRVV
jgi:hypothetical protein